MPQIIRLFTDRIGLCGNTPQHEYEGVSSVEQSKKKAMDKQNKQSGQNKQNSQSNLNKQNSQNKYDNSYKGN